MVETRGRETRNLATLLLFPRRVTWCGGFGITILAMRGMATSYRGMRCLQGQDMGSAPNGWDLHPLELRTFHGVRGPIQLKQINRCPTARQAPAPVVLAWNRTIGRDSMWV